MADGQRMTVADVVARVRDGRLEDVVSEAVAVVCREQLASRRSGEAVRALEKAFAHPKRVAQALAEMAAALEEPAGVIAFLARDCGALAPAREQMAGEVAGLVMLAGRLDEAADLGRR
jgi:hypothetical protein